MSPEKGIILSTSNLPLSAQVVFVDNKLDASNVETFVTVKSVGGNMVLILSGALLTTFSI